MIWTTMPNPTNKSKNLPHRHRVLAANRPSNPDSSTVMHNDTMKVR